MFSINVNLIPLNFCLLSVLALSQANQNKAKQNNNKLNHVTISTQRIYECCYYQMHKMEIALRKYKFHPLSHYKRGKAYSDETLVVRRKWYLYSVFGV